MRHLKHRHQLGRKKEHRQALMSNLAAALFRHGKIQTTLAKAKALRPFAEKVITLAKRAEGATPEKSLHYRRLAASRVRDRDALSVLFNERAKEFSDRTGGYTRIYKLGTRIGDGAEMAVIQLIAAEDEGYEKKRKKASVKPTAEAPVEEKAEVKEEEPVAEVAETTEVEASEAADESTEAEEKPQS